TWSAVPHETTTDLFGSLTCIGQMGRTVGDVAMMFNAMKGPDPRDPWSHGGSFAPVVLPQDPLAALRGLR
ncbi:amidase family protein, partial [Klebsiella pneumoniae]|uniref:amidase family protein n=1 Tax=Klebsiella pneumoniae TaxID=573 RepID=UPI0019546405